MKWNVFSLEAVKEALKPKFVLEKVRYVTDERKYLFGEETYRHICYTEIRLVRANTKANRRTK